MAAKIKRFQPKEKLVKQEQLEQLQSMLELFPELNERKASALLWEIKRKINLTPLTWTFIMREPEQNFAVIDWIVKESKRKKKLFACGFCYLIMSIVKQVKLCFHVKKWLNN